MPEPLLRLEGVTKSYGTTVITQALRGVDLEIQPGEFAALIGPSGSGKSTLLNLIGLLDRPTSGKYSLHGCDTATMDEERLSSFRGRSIGFVFQFHNLLPEFTAWENVSMPMLIDRGRRRAEMEAEARRLLDAVDLTDQADKKPLDMSGGQQQRVAIARSLAMHPPLVLADEPTGNLDTHTADEVFEVLRRFNEQEGITFLIVTHDPRLAERCDRTIQLVDGKIV
jgi:lipoprotein-releasing system ATP-binding protein